MANLQSQFWSKVAVRYDEVVDLQIGPDTRGMVREWLETEESLGKTVEFACGTGFYTGVLARKAQSLLATDLSEGMLKLAKERTKAANVTFQLEDCQKTTLPSGEFDTVFMGLVLHFTEPATVLREMHRILKPGGTLIIANLDPEALTGLNRLRCRIRVIFHGITKYQVKPPKGFGDNMLTAEKLRELLTRTGFKILSAETFRNSKSSTYIPLEYFRTVKI